MVDNFQEEKNIWAIEEYPENVKLFFENFGNKNESEEETSASESEEESGSDVEWKADHTDIEVVSTTDSEGEIQPSYYDLIEISSDEEEEKNIRLRRKKRQYRQESEILQRKKVKFKFTFDRRLKRKRYGRPRIY